MTDFYTYHENYTLYTQIIHHERKAINKCLQRVRSSVIITDHELDFYHWILKHVRACDEEPECEILGQVVQKRIQDILGVHQKVVDSYSLLVCILDIVKNDTLLDNDTLYQFVSLTCHLWQNEKIYMCRKSMELCKRILPIIPDTQVILPSVIHYIKTCKTVLTRQDIIKMRSPDYTEFFHHPTHHFTFDRECIKLIIQIIIFLFLYHQHDELIEELLTVIEGLHNYDPLELKTVLFDLCCSNDDDTIQLLDSILVLYQQSSSKVVDFLQAIDITPHTLFLFFLSRCGNTHDIIIDLLLENDSDFLSYFHRYIKFANQGHLHPSLKEEPFLTILANTILVLEGDGLPYDTKPLVRRLINLEETLYI